MSDLICPHCGLPRSEWKGEHGGGFHFRNLVYCCQGCALEHECTCLSAVGINSHTGPDWNI